MERVELMNWKLEDEGFDSDKITELGNRFLTGNGYMGVRGTLEEYKKEQLVAINLAGIYDRVGDGWREPLNAPNGLYTYIKVDSQIYSLPAVVPILHQTTLDFRKALLERKTIWKTERGQVTLQSERFASLEEPHLLVMKYALTTDFHADIEVVTGIDGDVWDINGPHYDALRLEEEAGILTVMATTHESKEQVFVAEGCQMDFFNENHTEIGDQHILHHIACVSEPGKPIEIVKWIAVYTSKDCSDFKVKAKQLIRDVKLKGYTASKEAHLRKWEEKWMVSEVIIEGDAAAMAALNYSIYHLHVIAPRHSKSLSIAARGLSGQTYKGAVFWDTEMFMLDFYLYTEPEVAKTLLKYRVDTIEGAKIKAKGYGYEGAFYAWESQEGGYDACSDYNVTDVFTGRPMRTYFKDKQIHISSAVVHGLMRYFEITGDLSIFEEGGAETVIECAKFYYSLLVQKVHENYFELHDVIGPDEYHERVNNNGYTNRMAKYTFDMAVRILHLQMGLSDKTLKHLQNTYDFQKLRMQFERASSALYIPQPDEEGVIEQFDGYKALEDTTVEMLKGRLLHEKEYWGGAYGIASHTQVIKQADVVTWLTLFPKDFSEAIMLKNWQYYEPRTEHGSSLSACMYALLACRCQMPDKAYPFFLKSARADLNDGGKQWAGLIYIGGTHPAAAGGAYMTAINGFGGLTFKDGEIEIKPQLPSTWKKLRFKIWFQKVLYGVEVTHLGAAVVKCS